MAESANIKVVQDMYDAFGHGDVQRILDRLDAPITWKGVYGAGPHVPTSGERRGKIQVGEFFKQVADSVSFSSFEPKEFIATGDTVVTLGHYTAKTPIGKTFDADFAMVFKLRNGNVIEFQEFTDSAAINASYAVAT